MLNRQEGKVLSIDRVRNLCVELTVECGDKEAKAIAYPQLTGDVAVGDTLLLNTTAVTKQLGTGGFHFVIANLSNPEQMQDTSSPGHIVKLRYTPLQHIVLSVEEEGSPARSQIEDFSGLNATPVVVCQLHSQLAPVTAAIKRSFRQATVAYIMTDSAALPVAFSRLATKLKDAGLIDCTITCGQAFGGDLEAVNIYTAIIAARTVVKADVIVICPGPGNTGTGTRFGYSSIEQGSIINAVYALGGQSVAVARISFADNRSRHYGISHHTLTALDQIALARTTLVLPMIDQSKLIYVQEQIARTSIPQKHKIRVIDPTPGIVEMQERGIAVTTMGRSYEQDPEFFQSASAAGRFAAELLKPELSV